MTKDQIEYLLSAWKYNTLTEMSKETKIFPSQLSLFFKRRGITLLTKYDIMVNKMKKELLNENNTIHELAKIFKTNERVIMRVLNQSGLKAKPVRIKKEVKKEPARIEVSEARKHAKVQAIIRKNKKYYEEHAPIKIERPPTVYNQYGSQFTDELRGITTTLRK